MRTTLAIMLAHLYHIISMDKIVATVLMLPKQLSNLPDRIALRIQKALGMALVTYSDNNVHIDTNSLHANNAYAKYNVPTQHNCDQLKSRLLCRYEDQIFVLLADKSNSPQTISVYDITSAQVQEIRQSIEHTSTSYSNTNEPDMSLQDIDQYIQQSPPRQVTI